jgi:hypothetical protein
MKPIINLDEVTFEHHTHGDKFEARDGPLSERLGAKQHGYSIAVVPPGRGGGAAMLGAGASLRWGERFSAKMALPKPREASAAGGAGRLRRGRC